MKLSDIKPGKNFSRTFGVGDVSELVDSMLEHGQITPIIVDESGNLIAGYRRFTAATQLGWTEIDAIVRPGGNAGVINLIENMNRTGLSLWEEIQGIRDVFGPDAKISEIARALSKSRNWVRPRTEIWNQDQAFINKVRNGQSGVDEIRRVISEKAMTPAPTRNLNLPSQDEIMALVTTLMSRDRGAEARALSFACGSLDAETILCLSDKGDC